MSLVCLCLPALVDVYNGSVIIIEAKTLNDHHFDLKTPIYCLENNIYLRNRVQQI